jgi:hypothetical protein
VLQVRLIASGAQQSTIKAINQRDRRLAVRYAAKKLGDVADRRASVSISALTA